MNTEISSIDAMEILDSRGNPTIKVWVRLRDGTVVRQARCTNRPSEAGHLYFRAYCRPQSRSGGKTEIGKGELT
jgi:enolase